MWHLQQCDVNSFFWFAEALSACHYIPACREKIFNVLYKALNHPSNNDLRESAYECMKKVRALCILTLHFDFVPAR